MSVRSEANMHGVRRLSNALRLLADELENNPELGRKISDLLEKAGTQPGSGRGGPPLDLYTIFGQGGEQALAEKLLGLDIGELRIIVQRNGMDPSSLAIKWRRKERLVQFIIERVSERARLGQAFKSDRGTKRNDETRGEPSG